MEEVRFTGKTAHISLDRYQSLLEAERKLIDIKEQENDMINIPIKQYWELNQAKEELLDLKFPNIPSEPFPPESKIRATEQEFNCVIKGPVPIEEILNEREETHGKFEDHAAITDAIKFDMQQSSNWSTLGSMKREALDMIAHKIGRILAGNPNVKDHWDDIAGYATLISRELK